MIRNLVSRHSCAVLIAAALALGPARVNPQESQDQAAPQAPNSNPRDLKRVPPENSTSPTNTVPQSYALVVGIAHYANLPGSGQLAYPERDAQDIFTTLISQQGGQFPLNHVHLLTGAQATKANISRELEGWLASVTTPNDRVLIYFAGHGFIYGGRGYLAPYDVDLHNIDGTAIPMDKLGTLIGTTIKGKFKVLLTDACHTGAITPETDPTAVNHLLKDLGQSIFSLTASRDREQSFEGAWGGGHGVFTYFVVQGLAGYADADGDGRVTADELAEYVHSNVRRETGGKQNPTSDRGSFDPNMVLAYNPEHVKPQAQPDQYGTLIVQSNMDNTELWVDEKLAGVLSKSTALRLSGLKPGSHTIKAVHMGYEPDGPREEMIYPGQETTVNVRILIPRQRKQAALDLVDEGVALYKKGSAANYKQAEAKFNQAIAIEPNYSEAYMYLGRAENALLEDDRATASFQRAISIDPDYEEARVSYASALLDTGNFDEAARQLNGALERQPTNGTALYLMSVVYAREGDFADGKTTALKAVAATPGNGEAHFWLAQCERHLNQASDAEAEYKEYLRLTSFNSGVVGNANYYVLGFLFGFGQRHRAAQQDIWREQQGSANLGICDCERMLKRYDAAIPYCDKALNLMPGDLWANYCLGVIYVDQANAKAAGNGVQPTDAGTVKDLLKEAKTRFNNVLATNPDTDEASRARQYIAQIDAALEARP